LQSESPTEGIVVRTLGGGRDGERKIENSRLEDPLRSNQSNALSVEQVAFLEKVAREHVAVALDLLG